MSAARPRHVVTETDEVAAALDEAAARWPDETSRARLLVRLVEAGRRALVLERQQAAAERAAAVEETSGVLTGVYGPGYLREIRSEWPD